MTDQDTKKTRASNRRKKRLPFDSQSERRQQRLFESHANATANAEWKEEGNAEADALFRDLAKKNFCRFKDCARLALPGKGFCRAHHEEINDVVKGTP